MKTAQQKLGAWAEWEAEYYLRSRGYRTVARNFRIGRAEVDRIMDYNGLCVFVEVKMRSTDKYGDVETHFRPAQARMLLEAAERFMESYPNVAEVRFDLMAITGTREKYSVRHWPDCIPFPFELGL